MMPARAILGAIFALFLACAAIAQQQNDAPDYDAWNRQATQVEQIVQSGDASDAQLQQIRGDIVTWRNRFEAAQTTNAPRIQALNDQITALGDPPAEGQTEATDIADRRKALNDELSQLQAPGQRATEAYSRADSVVKEIDSQLRERKTNAILHLAPSPLLPSSWMAALQDGQATLAGISGDFSEATRAGRGATLRDNAPEILLYLAAALFLMTRGRIWVAGLPGRLSARATDHSRKVVAFLVSLAQIIIPIIGIQLLILAMDRAGVAGEWTRPLMLGLPMAGLIAFGGRWLAQQVFPADDQAEPPFIIPNPQRKRARADTILLATLLAVHYLLARALLPQSGFFGHTPGEAVPLQFSDASAGVWHLPLLLLAAFAFYHLCNILRQVGKFAGGETTSYRLRMMGFVANLGRLISILAPVTAAIGYTSASNAQLWSSILTIALLCFVFVLQDFIADVYQMARRGAAGARDELVPVLVGFLLIVAALPLFALIWGARVADLIEWWAQIEQGVSVGGISLSPGAIVTFLVVFTLGYALTRFVQGALRTTILPKTRLDAGAQNAAVSGLGYVGLFLAGMVAVSSAGINLSSLAIVAGALSVGIGFGMQNIVSNFVSGIILLIERPITVGDWIDVGGSQGYVRDISVRSTRIQTFDRTDVIVPNSDLISQPVTNWTRGNLSGRIIVRIGVAYGTDTRQVEALLREIAEDQPTVLINPAPVVLFVDFGADSLNFEIRAVLSDINGGATVSSNIRHEIARRFAEEGIEIPFAQRDIWLRNPESLTVTEAAPVAEPAPAIQPAKGDPGIAGDAATDAQGAADNSGTGGGPTG